MKNIDAVAYLNSLPNIETKLQHTTINSLDLSATIELLDRLDNPQLGLNVVHIAGTKGKGSTSLMIASVLQHAGLRVGLYTSPHFYHVSERIRVLDQSLVTSREDFPGSIPLNHLNLILEDIHPVIDAMLAEGKIITYFEVLTVVAIIYFAAQRVDVAILETGLGGRLDATNAIDSHIAVITSISLDHQHILGDSLASIAREKAGIIKDKYQTVITCNQDPDVMAVIQERCASLGIEPVIADVASIKGWPLGLIGEHQKINAACSYAVIQCLINQGFNISHEVIKQGLSQVKWPGRFERFDLTSTVIIDGAHNGASAQALVQTLNEQYSQRSKTVILGASIDKDIEAIIKPLKNVAHFFILTKADHPRSLRFTHDMAKNFLGDVPFEIIDDLPQALRKVLDESRPDEVIVITGSLFLAAQARVLCTSIKI